MLLRSSSSFDSGGFGGSKRKGSLVKLTLTFVVAPGTLFLLALLTLSIQDNILHAEHTLERTSSASIFYDNISFPLCFVHIGKASGSTVSCSLGLGYADCQNKERQPQAHSSDNPQQKQLHYFHLRQNTCPASSKTYVISVRHPLTRLLSWFDFERTSTPHRSNPRDQERLRQQRALLFQECYSADSKASRSTAGEDHGIVALARHGLAPLPDNLTLKEQLYQMPCHQRAWAAVLGAREVSYHEYFNYEYYWLGMHQRRHGNNATVIVLRTEHLEQGASAVSRAPLLGKLNEQSADRRVATPSVLPEDAQRNLCRALCMEFQFYFQFLQLADNLAPEQVEESVQEVQAQCPHIQPGKPCTDLPMFPPLYIHKSQYARMIKKRFYRAIE